MFSLPLKEITVVTTLTGPNFAALEAKKMSISENKWPRQQVRAIQALFLLPVVPAPGTRRSLSQGLRAGQDFTFI